jgi:hypothetical protein
MTPNSLANSCPSPSSTEFVKAQHRALTGSDIDARTQERLL